MRFLSSLLIIIKMKIPTCSYKKLILCYLVALVLKATAQSLDILDKNLGLDFTHFEVDVNSKHGREVIETLANDPNQMALDSHFT